MKSFLFRYGRFRKLSLPVIVSGMLITILSTALYLAKPHSIKLVDNRLYDLCLQLSLSGIFSSETGSNQSSVNQDQSVVVSDTSANKTEKNGYTSVIVDIDEYSLKRFGQWPWPRYHVASLIRKIYDAGATAVGIDILFSEPDRTSLVVMQRALKEEFNIDIAFSEHSNNLIRSHNIMDNDILLAQAINKTSATLGYYFTFEDQLTANKMEPAMAKSDISQRSPADLPPFEANIAFEPGNNPDSLLLSSLFSAVDIVPPIPVLLHREEDDNREIKTNIGTSAGFMNIIADDDGVLRRTPLFIAWNGQIYPQLALATMLNLRYAKRQEKISEPLIKISSNGVESIKLDKTVVPLERNGSMMLNYRGKSRTFQYISAGKILESRVNSDKLKDKIVFIGSSAAGLKDIRISPLDLNFPGIEVHATIVDNILKGDFISRPDWSSALETVLTVLCGIVTTILIGVAAPLMTLIASMTAAGSIFLTTVWALEMRHIWISPLFALITLSANFALLNLVKYALSEKDKKFYRTAFGHYVSRSVVNQIIESPKKLNLEGEEKEVSILFSDIRNFSTISENLSPSQVSRLLHDYFTPATKIVLSHQGTLDKFIGDAMMCFWNAPLNVGNHKLLALNAAIKILAALEELSNSFQKEYGVKIRTGIGVHSGVCRVGNMGSADLFDYTVIGDHVNIASRLEGLTKFYGVDLVFSEAMIPESNESMRIQYIDRVRVKGKTEPVNIYTAHAIKSVVTQIELEQYDDAIALYKNRNFKGAFKAFSELEKLTVQNGKIDINSSNYSKLYHIYKQRALQFMNEPLENGWDGVYNHITK